GKVASYIPELSKANPSMFGIVVSDMQGITHSAGNTRVPFTLQSTSKPFALALALMDNGAEKVFSKIGMEPTGDSFNSLLKLETFASLKPVNPFVNAGAITVSSMIHGGTPEEKFARLFSFIESLTGGCYLGFNRQVYLSEKMTGDRNRAIGYFLRDIKAIEGETEPVLDLYFRQCSIETDCFGLSSLAVAIATEEDSVIPKIYKRILRSFMFTCGMYDASGEFAIRVGVPSKSGVSGAILSAVPGRFGIGVIGPSLDHKGNSVAGVPLLEDLSEKLGLYVF
ncbi:MAG: glutaminase A, partial [bacterium]|nr:glutaminase A [bacterium]